MFIEEIYMQRLREIADGRSLAYLVNKAIKEYLEKFKNPTKGNC